MLLNSKGQKGQKIQDAMQEKNKKLISSNKIIVSYLSKSLRVVNAWLI